jgi:hypothetical protein
MDDDTYEHSVWNLHHPLLEGIMDAIQDSDAPVQVLEQRLAQCNEQMIAAWLGSALRVAVRGLETPLNRDKLTLLLNHPSMSKQMIDGTHQYSGEDSAIRCAAQAGNITALKMLLADKRVDRHSIAKDHSLMVASYNALQVLLKDDRVDYALLHAVDGQKRTILIRVVQRADYYSLKLLLSDERVDDLLLAKVDCVGQTVLHHAVTAIGETRLVIEKAQHAIVELLLNHPHLTQQCFDITDHNGCTILMRAVRIPYADSEIVRLLLKDNKMTREHFRRTDCQGKTVLMWAAMNGGSAEALRLLLGHPYMDKEFIDACDTQAHMTALMYLVWRTTCR